MTNDFATIDSDELVTVNGGYSQQLFAAMQEAVSRGMTINSTTTGGHAAGSYHYQGRAFDTIGTESQMQGFFNWARTQNGTPTELIHRNHFIKNGRPIHPIGGHDTHVHLAY